MIFVSLGDLNAEGGESKSMKLCALAEAVKIKL